MFECYHRQNCVLFPCQPSFITVHAHKCVSILYTWSLIGGYDRSIMADDFMLLSFANDAVRIPDYSLHKTAR